VRHHTSSASGRSLTYSHSRLGKTVEAVEAASGSIVSWGPRRRNRTDAIETLKRVLREATDLEKYVAFLDGEAARTQQDRPIVRKAVGQVYFEKRQYDRAAAQVHEKQWDEASETLEGLKSKAWPSRFGDVEQQIQKLRRQIETGVRRKGG